MLKAWLSGLSRAARMGLVIGVLAILATTGAAAWWLLRVDYQVLFVNLAPQDASIMMTELERMKVPHKLGADGTSILVDRSTLHETRIALMSRDLALHGAVGFELFNTSDFGMTEFAQKVNYQRALQGELTRTIAALSEIETVRVHLVLPEDSLFRRDDSRPKASITVTPKAGRALRAPQVAGIQRLVAAAVPGIALDDVTIIDQQGVALTRSTAREADGAGSGVDSQQQLELKRETEQYLSRKVATVLDRLFGAGEALASVDVVLNLDQIKSTSEEIIGAPTVGATMGASARGVVVREREIVRDGAPLPERGTTATQVAAPGSVQRELDYQVGRRVEQVVTSPGSIRRIQVVAAIRQPLDAAQAQRVQQVVAAAVGASLERGDTVVVQTLSELTASNLNAAPTSAPAAPSTASATSNTPPNTVATTSASLARRAFPPWEQEEIYIALAAAFFLIVIVLLYVFLRVRHRAFDRGSVTPMDETQRHVTLKRIETWLAAPDAVPTRTPIGAP